MKQFLILAGIALAISACSMDEESKAKLDRAAKHAKEAAVEVGEVVSKQASETHEKWSKMNENRIEEAPKEDLGFAQEDADVGDLERRIKAAKEAFFDESDKKIEQSKQGAEVKNRDG